ncbi:hypothetical protein O7627_13095 [Solwaraspora sp. WMMD1047]|uniref:hypothetical protein n=1 Tax=Solwaraspora sp. WMMD1047 TaxID=3016102 RepID=UPI0024177CD5|nr:hypothetical protein [Solwaraspora sp. WMMD1047]MDG4830235.1 hypothetical protein [Solwaraspora sp. WMMD1047]
MTDEIKRLLDEELAGRPAPPIGDLVEVAVARGRRMRRTRALRLGSAGAAGAAAAVVAVLALGLPGLGGGIAGPGRVAGPGGFAGPPPDASAPTDGTASPTLSPTDCAPTSGTGGSPAIELPPGASPTRTDPAGQSAPFANRLAGPDLPCPPAREPLRLVPVQTGTADPPAPGRLPDSSSDDALVPASPAGVLELLTRLLPPGQTSEYAVAEPGGSSGRSIGVQIYLDRGAGPAMIRAWIDQAERPGVDPPCESWQTCYPVPGGGQVAVAEHPDNCVQRRSITLYRADGLVISMNLADCLMWDGRTNPPSRPALDTQEAVDVMLDPRWGMALPADLVDVGNRRFRSLPTIQGG